jgi:hypothetical protein
MPIPKRSTPKRDIDMVVADSLKALDLERPIREADIDRSFRVLVCQATDELSKTGTLRDETLSELLEKYGESISRKIVLMIAWFNLLSRFLNGCRVPLETTDKIGTGTSPLGRQRFEDAKHRCQRR